MASNNDGQIVLGLDIPKTVSQINSDIKKLQNQLEQIKATGALDTSSTIKQINAQISALQGQLKNIDIKTNIDISNVAKTGQRVGQTIADNAQKVIDNKNINLDKLNADIKTLTNSLNNFSSKNVGFDTFKTEVNGVEISLNSLISKLSVVDNTIDFSTIRSQANALKSAFLELSQLNKIQLGIDTEKYSTEIYKIQQTLSNFGSQSGEAFTKVTASLQQMKNAYEGMKTSDGDERLNYEKEYHTALETTKNLLTQIKSVKSNELISSDDNRRVNYIAELNNYLSKNTGMTEQNRQTILKWIATLDSADDITRETFDNIKSDFKTLDATLRQTGQLGLSWSDKLKQAWEKFGGWSIATGTLTTVLYKIKESISEIQELDNILTEVSKTSDLTMQELKELGLASYDTASKYGRTASDYLAGVQSMSQSGFYREQGEAMAEQSLLAQAAGDMSKEVADKYVLATNAAYKFNGEAQKLNAVLDGQNSISNRNSVALEDMALAMSEAGTTASSYRVSVEDFSAMVGTMEAVTKSGGSEVGNAIKSVLINLQNVTSDKITSTLDKANASMTEFVNGAEKLRNPIEILRDLADTFNTLDEDDPLRAEILTNIGGKYQATKLAALLQNMDMFDKMLVDYSEGEGSAMEEAEKSATNLTGSLNTLSNSWTELVNSIISSDELKIGINILNDLVQGTTKFVSALNLIPIAISAIYTATNKSGGLIRLINPINNSPFLATVEFNSDVCEFCI